MVNAPDTLVFSGEVLQQVALGSALITPSGGSQTTLADALATTGAGLAKVASVPALRNTGPTPNGIIFLSGYALPNDGGQDLFQWEVGNTNPDDGGTTFAWSENPGTTGPNIFPSPITWDVTAGSPTLGANGAISDSTTEFWQAQVTLTGLVVGVTYLVSVDYTLAAGSGPYVAMRPQSSGPTFQQTLASTPTPWSFTFVATVTTEFWQVAGQNAAGSLSNFFIGEAPGGRWVRSAAGPPSVLWWGADPSDTNDSTAAFQAAIDYVVTGPPLSGGAPLTQVAGRLRWPSGIYKFTSGIIINQNRCAIIGEGCTLDFTGVTGTAITMKGTAEDTNQNYFGSQGTSLCGFGMIGPGPTLGAAIGYDGSADVEAAQRHQDIWIFNFGIGVDWSAPNLFEITLEHMNIWGCGVCISCVGNPSNTGEVLRARDVSLFNSVVGIEWQNSNGAFWLENCDIDYNHGFIRNRGGWLFLHHCHLETNIWDSPLGWQAPITHDTQTGSTTLTETELVWTNGGVGAPSLIYSAAAQNGAGVRLTRTTWSGWGNNDTSFRLTVVDGSALISAQISSPLLTVTGSGLVVTAATTATIGFGNAPTALGNCGILGKGKFYFTFTVNALTTTGVSQGIAVGVAANNITTADAMVEDGAALWWQSFVASPSTSGIGFSQSLQIANLQFGLGDKVWVVCDGANGLFWFSKDNGTTWNGSASFSPAAGTGGQSLSFPQSAAPGIPFVPACSLATTGDQGTFDFNPSLSGVTGLAGFSPWANLFTLGGGGAVSVRESLPAFLPYPALMDVNNSLGADPAFESGSGTTFVDAWSLTLDTAAITSRTTGTNISITQNGTKPFSGFLALVAVKAGAAATVAAFGQLLKLEQRDNIAFGVEYAASANSLGTVTLNVKYVNLNYYGSGGVPVFGQESLAFSVVLTPTTTYQPTRKSVQNAPPSWTTHVLLEFDMGAMAAGTLYLDNCEPYRF